MWDEARFAFFQEMPPSGGLLGSGAARLRNAKGAKASRVQKCEHPVGMGSSPRALVSTAGATLARTRTRLLDCDVAALLVAGRLGEPPL
jgi:hypothetical protein